MTQIRKGQIPRICPFLLLWDREEVCPSNCFLLVPDLQGGEEGLLGQLDVAHALHALFAFLLLFEELALTGNVATVALGGYVLAERGNGFAGDDLLADGG